MNGKKFANGMFLIIGTCIIISISTVVAINIFADSKLFITKENEESITQVVQKDTVSKNPEYNTFKYQRDFETDEQIENKKPVKPKVTPTSTNSTTSAAIKLEIINNSSLESASTKLKTTLESNGFIVTVNNSDKTKTATTSIIERNDKGTGIQLQKALKMGKIIKAYKANYKYDLTLIIGEDYNP